MRKIRTTKWDAAEHLEGVEDSAAYLEAALEDSDSALIAAAEADVSRAEQRRMELLRALEQGEREIAADRGHDLDDVLAEADDALRRLES